MNDLTELVTSAQMRAIERTAIESGAVTGAALMERAGAAAIAAVFDEWPALATGVHRAVVLCGPGNNGGDGFVIARLLKERGWEVAVILYGDPGKLPPAAQTNYRRWQGMGEVRLLDEEVVRPECDLVVDALFGTGLTRPLQGQPLQRLSEALEELEQDIEKPLLKDPDSPLLTRFVAVDVPSGLCADSGRVLRAALQDGAGFGFRADLTVTFHRMKPGHLLADGPRQCGKVVVADIGLRGAVTGAVQRVEVPDLNRLRKVSGHKFDHGHALVLTGGLGRSGAARLAARAALRIGAGLVTLGAPGSAMLECACQITGLMLRRIDSAEDLGAALQDRRITALCLGPGLGTGRAAALLEGVRAGPAPDGFGLVLDADALTALAPLAGSLPPRCVLTPHGGEFARLFPDLAARLAEPAGPGPAFSKLDATRAAAARAGCIVLFKGADTVIAAPDGSASIHAAVHDRAAPWLATAGAGDVLAGLICGLMARGAAPMAAAEAAVWLHVEAARAFGPGLIAEDLPEAIPGVLRALAV